jgi:tRNA-dihydrouridine synthase B
MRRHYTNYLRGLPNIKEYRLKLVTISEVAEIDDVLEQITNSYDGYEFKPRLVDMDSMAYNCD